MGSSLDGPIDDPPDSAQFSTRHVPAEEQRDTRIFSPSSNRPYAPSSGVIRSKVGLSTCLYGRLNPDWPGWARVEVGKFAPGGYSTSVLARRIYDRAH